ncbi:MAG: ArsA family ATPase [Chloroherpetonaceae bacterium]|nr:ArsA family ATPase [Chloroherpetonaceae bacterium]
MRIIIYLGKGGVGKTTVSAATAAKIANSGKRVLIMSTDIAHSLGDAFGAELSDSPREVFPNLFAMEINVLAEIRNHWSLLHDYFSSMLMNEGASEVVADELAIIPGMEEMMSLKHIWEASKSGKYDVIIVDAAPTGETMRLLAMPDSYQWYTKKIASWHTRVISFAMPLIEKLMPKKNVFKLMPEIGEQIKELHGYLLDPKVTSYRIVVNPENMVIREALRAQTYLNLFGYTLDAVVVNKIFPEGALSKSMKGLFEQQQRYLKQIDQFFYPLPIFKVKHFENEVIGNISLSKMGESLFQTELPEEILYNDFKTHTIEKSNGKYLLKLYLPNVEIDHVQMNVKGDELLIEVNNFRKNIVLPNVLVGRKTDYAAYENGRLNVFFC